jgi:hypothetical protein
MTNSYARDAFTYGFDFPRPRSRAERLARLDALLALACPRCGHHYDRGCEHQTQRTE